MKQLIFIFFIFMVSVVHADSNYSGVWKGGQGQYYSIHQLADSLVMVELSSKEIELSPYVQGSQMFTDNQLDLAISGYGFFIIELEDGGYIYTRKGDFKLSANGTIVNDRGEKLVIEEGKSIPDTAVGLIVKSNGIINIPLSNGDLFELGRIKLASISPKDLQYVSATRFKSINEDTVTYFYPLEEQEGGSSIQQGGVELLRYTSQNWAAYTGKLIDNQATMNSMSKQDGIDSSKEIIFNSESTAILKPIGVFGFLPLLAAQKVQLIKIF